MLDPCVVTIGSAVKVKPNLAYELVGSLVHVPRMTPYGDSLRGWEHYLFACQNQHATVLMALPSLASLVMLRFISEETIKLYDPYGNRIIYTDPDSCYYHNANPMPLNLR